MKKQISAVLVASVIATNTSPVINIFADEVIKEKSKILEKRAINQAKVTQFTISNNRNFEAYNEKFRVSRDEIKSISNNGGRYNSSTILDNAIDGNMSTHWETGNQNSADFKNDVVIEFNDVQSIDRIAYATRQDGAKGKGYPTKFEIYSSITGNDEDFELVSTGAHPQTGNMMEFKFDTITTKKIKFVFKEAHDGWASASEFWFYKEDKIMDKLNTLFTDSTMSKVSESFNTTDKLNELEKEAKEHPLYEDFKEDIENAKLLVENKQVEYIDAKISKFSEIDSENISEYNKKFKAGVSKVSNNGKQSSGKTIDRAFDGDINTEWLTGTLNSATFNNEVLVELDELTILDRIVYSNTRGTKRGFAQEFEIYASKTSKGETFELVTKGSMEPTQDSMEIKFNPTEVKRLKFVYKKGVDNWACASEFGLYKPDEISDKMDRLFTDSSMSKVSDEFNSLEIIEALEKEVKEHLLYDIYKEDIGVAKDLLTRESIESTKAAVSRFDVYYTDKKEDYDNKFKMNNDNIASITNNGGQYSTSELKYAIDGNPDTHWETGTPNSDTFKNEVVFDLNNATVLNRITYKSRNGNKGFAKEFEIWGSTASKGDNFTKVSEGSYNVTGDFIEIKFNPTKFKRIKFVYKTAHEDMAAASEFIFYKQDNVYEKVNSMFKNKLMTELKDEFNSKEVIDAIAAEVNNHPLKDDLDYLIKRAYKIANNDTPSSSIKMTLPQLGDIHRHAKQDLLMSSFGTNLISTGLVATPGEVFEVYVDAEEGQPMPKIAFTQSQGHYRKWKQEFTLKPGYNKITAPNLYDSNWSHKTNPGGAVYIVNPYTAEEQGKAQVVSIEGGRKFPVYNEGDDVNKFLEELKEYKKFMDENPDTAVNIFEYNSPRLLHTGLADAAYQVYVKEGVSVEESVKLWSDITQRTLDFAGLEDNPEVREHDSTNLRTTLRVMQPAGAAYAAGDHIGIQNHVADDFLRTDQKSVNGIIWGMVHEIGHQLDIGPRTWGEVTNNMWANRLSIDAGKSDAVGYSAIYNNGATDKKDVKGYYDFELKERLSMFWQLEAYHNGYWSSLERMYRERKPSPKNEEEKRDILAKYSSEILGKDLTEYFARYKFDLSEECKKELSKFEKTTDKIWYGNTTVQTYKGSGFTDNLDLQVNTEINKENKTVTLSMSVDKENEDDKLGYEILKDGKVIGYTTGNKFVIKDANVDSNETYQVKAYDRKFGSSDALDINTFKPSIESIDKVTLKLGEEFNPEKYVKAFSYDGEILDSVEIKNNVNTNEKGIYTVTYSVTNEGIKVSKDMEVEVVSDYDYLSDEEWKSVETQWGTPRRNSNIKARVNGDVKEFEKGFGIHANGSIVYDLSDKDYDNFEAMLGVDAGISAQNSSSITFKVVGDGKVLATTKVLKHADDAVYINVPVKGVKELRIEIHDGGNGNNSDHAVVANPKLTTNNAKPKLTTENKTYKLGEKVDFIAGVKANDAEDGDLTSKVEIASNNYEQNKTGRFEVIYKVTDKDNNVVEKKSYITVYEEFVINKSKFGQFDNLDKYNEEFKLNISSVSNNAGSYKGSPIGNAIDGNVNTHWETNNQNSDTFKNEVIFDLGESQEISKIAYAARRNAGGKGFANAFEIYVSNEAEGNDFILAGKGEYRGNYTDVVEFNISKTTARRVKFKFVEANQNWASIGEMSFYKEDTLADKIVNNLFTDSTKTEVSEAYNTLDELEALREEVKNHPAVKLFEEDLNKAEEIIRAKFPTLNVEDITYVKASSDFDLMDGVSASDKEDGNLTSSIKVDNEKFNINRGGEYTLTYSVIDRDNNVTTKERKVIVYNENSYLTDLHWESAVSGWKSVNKDSAVNTKNKIKLKVNDEVKEFDRGIGAATNAEIVYNLDRNYNYFTTYVGTDKNYDHNSTTIRFKIFADGKEVYTSDVIRKNSEAEFVNLDVSGVKELKLVADDVDNNGLGDFASWGDSKLYSIAKLDTTELEKAIEEAEKLDLNNYSNESVVALEKAIVKAKEALEFDNQESIDSATQELKNLMSSLVEVDLTEVVSIPDKYLKQSLQKALNKTGDITLGDMRSLTTLTLSGVEILDGMEYAINLETLSMDYNEVKDLRPLANLKKLKNLNATQQFVSAGNLYPSNGKVVVDSKVYNREGKNIAKTVRLVDKFGAPVIEKDAEDEFVIGTTDLKAGTYAVHVLFEDEGFDGIMLYMFDIK